MKNGKTGSSSRGSLCRASWARPLPHPLLCTIQCELNHKATGLSSCVNVFQAGCISSLLKTLLGDLGPQHTWILVVAGIA